MESNMKDKKQTRQYRSQKTESFGHKKKIPAVRAHRICLSEERSTSELIAE